MKLTAFLLIGATAVSAFAPSPAHLGRPSTSLRAARPDASAAIKEALDASKKYGATSPEARVAWDKFSAASVGVAEVETPAEYQEKVEALAALLKEQQEKIASIKSLAEDLKGIKLSKPEGGSSSVDSAQMSKALEEAKSATEKFGMDSNEAKLAWETVEEIASSDVGEALKGSLEEECLVETIDACEAIEALQAALSKNEAKP
eukprot:CAMPEP_0178731750 /NCGR_PEP_ID=MMETSP0699-20121125/30201_1 /TAXON_ID=265572 /ORGANISM="Extubocellulus spinifer, Strain CCMP396" /LENGTH=203 /DNA_ID=CAMNT_0020383827 /DNA_START=211 /DNA_END=823 /DNA_ORIENTATION=-